MSPGPAAWGLVLLMAGGCDESTLRVEERGIFKVRTFEKGAGNWHGRPHYAQVWLRGKMVRFGTEDFQFCDLAPGAHPSGVVCMGQDGARGYDLIREGGDGPPSLVRLLTHDWGRWGREGRYYLYDWRYTDAATGQTTTVPHPLAALPVEPGEGPDFLSLSPDQSELLWEDRRRDPKSGARLDVVRVTEVASGREVLARQMTRSQEPWYWTHVHGDGGETAHGLADHFQWVKRSSGRYEIVIVADPPSP